MPTRHRDAENILSLTDSVVENLWSLEYPGNVLTLTGEITSSILIKTVVNGLNLTQTVSHNNLINVSVDNTLTFTQDTFFTSGIDEVVSDTLSLTQAVSQSIITVEASSTLNLIQDVDYAVPLLESASSDLSACILTAAELLLPPDQIAALCATRGLRHEVEYQLSIKNVSLTSYLQLTQLAANYQSVSASNHIHFLQTVELIEHYEELVSNLHFIQSADWHKVYPLESVLDLTSVATYDAIFNRSLTSSILFTQDVAASIPNILTPSPPFTPPTLIPQNYIRLTWPYSGPTLTVDMRNPLFNNVEQLEFRRINRRVRGGTLQIYRDDIWPEAERLIYKFNYLTEAKIDEYMHFLDQSLGQEVGLLDFEGRQWRGIILTPAALTKDENGRGCKYSTSFEFEGAVV